MFISQKKMNHRKMTGSAFDALPFLLCYNTTDYVKGEQKL